MPGSEFSANIDGHGFELVIGNGELGIGHRALVIGHWALGIGHW
ncbi:MAG: hypothetical protein QQW96_18255 [Tychonema bourrellyi B0820]|nr:hypothetical protein [Tychonema bourrellyi]MDQ2099577.1 hypothetical protein [Tychonema bourrellyi B0820]